MIRETSLVERSHGGKEIGRSATLKSLNRSEDGNIMDIGRSSANKNGESNIRVLITLPLSNNCTPASETLFTGTASGTIDRAIEDQEGVMRLWR